MIESPTLRSLDESFSHTVFFVALKPQYIHIYNHFMAYMIEPFARRDSCFTVNHYNWDIEYHSMPWCLSWNSSKSLFFHLARLRIQTDNKNCFCLTRISVNFYTHFSLFPEHLFCHHKILKNVLDCDLMTLA